MHDGGGRRDEVDEKDLVVAPYRLPKRDVQKSVLHIELKNRPLANCDDGPNRSHLSHGSKGLLIVNPILLCVTPGN